MKKLFLLAIFSLFLFSCGGSKGVSKSKKKSNRTSKITNNTPVNKNTDGDILVKIINNARSFEGTRYKFGGTTKGGMDCSGLVYSAFKAEGVLMPRVSRDMAKKGKKVSLKNVTSGDLVFFRTNGRKTINHVGLVIESEKGELMFIHSTTSKGVIISSLNESYWKNAFVEVRRII